MNALNHIKDLNLDGDCRIAILGCSVMPDAGSPAEPHTILSWEYTKGAQRREQDMELLAVWLDMSERVAAHVGCTLPDLNKALVAHHKGKKNYNAARQQHATDVFNAVTRRWRKRQKPKHAKGFKYTFITYFNTLMHKLNH